MTQIIHCFSLACETKLKTDKNPRTDRNSVLNKMFIFKWSISNLSLNTAKWVCVISELCRKWIV